MAWPPRTRWLVDRWSGSHQSNTQVRRRGIGPVVVAGNLQPAHRMGVELTAPLLRPALDPAARGNRG